MAAADLFDAGVAAALAGMLFWAAISDIRSRIIPNTLVLAVIGLFIVWAFGHRGEPIVSGLFASSAMFVATTVLYARRAIGGGDAKLLSSVAMFAGWDHLLEYLLVTAIAGGAIALIALALQPQRTMLMLMTRRSVDHGPRVPYGVAIAIGGMVLIWSRIGLLPSVSEMRGWLLGL